MCDVIKGFVFLVLGTCHVIPVAPCIIPEYNAEGIRLNLVPKMKRDSDLLLKKYCTSLNQEQCEKDALRQETKWLNYRETGSAVLQDTAMAQIKYMGRRVSQAIALINWINLITKLDQTKQAVEGISDNLKNVKAILQEQLNKCEETPMMSEGKVPSPVRLPETGKAHEFRDFRLALVSGLRRQVFLLKAQIEYMHEFPHQSQELSDDY